MRKNLSCTIVVAVLGVILVPTVAVAEATGFYAYTSAGSAESSRKDEVDTALINSGITALTSSEDKRDAAYKLQLGYQFNRYLAVEGGYVDMGKFTYQAASTAPVTATRDGHVEIDGWNLGVVGRLPFANTVSAFGKIGVVSYDLSYSCSGTGSPCANPDRSADGTPFYYGVGLDWNVTQNWFARIEYEVFTDIGDSFDRTGVTGTTEADVRMTSIGIGYKF